MILSNINFDATISVGHLITIATTIGAVLLASWRITIRLVKMEVENDMKMKLVWTWYCKVHNLNGTKNPDQP